MEDNGIGSYYNGFMFVSNKLFNLNGSCLLINGFLANDWQTLVNYEKTWYTKAVNDH